jgi:hypothetical protein
MFIEILFVDRTIGICYTIPSYVHWPMTTYHGAAKQRSLEIHPLQMSISRTRCISRRLD